MTRKNCKLSSIIALLLALTMLLAGCSLEDIPLIGRLFKPAASKDAEMIPTAAATLPVQTTAPQPVETEPVEIEPVETEPVETEPLMYWVRAEGGLNVRSGPGLDYAIVDNLPNGSCVFPERWYDGWAYITSPYVGWCSGDYLYLDPPTSGEESSGSSVQWIVSNGTALYSGPGTNYECMWVVDAGVKVSASRWEGNWVYVEVSDYFTGWCTKDRLTNRDPYPNRQPADFLSYRKPEDNSLVGRWVIVSGLNANEYAKFCRGGVLELREDGTFTHTVYDFYKYLGESYSMWHCPGTETSGGDCPYWTGEYTYDGETLVLIYRGECVSQWIYDTSGFPMPAEHHWNVFQKQVILKVTAAEAGIVVDKPWEIPVYTEAARGDSAAESILFRSSGDDGFGEICRILEEYYP